MQYILISYRQVSCVLLYVFYHDGVNVDCTVHNAQYSCFHCAILSATWPEISHENEA